MFVTPAGVYLADALCADSFYGLALALKTGF